MDDHEYLMQALHEARAGAGFCAPNPAVGALIVSESKVLALGHHKGPGRLHAEVEALHQLKEQQQTGSDLQSATLYVTLEPCCHHGRTPPCTDAIIESGIKHVVYGRQDPNPAVAGKGAALLRKAGIKVKQIELPEITRFYEPYTYWHAHKRPWVKIKLAMTQDHVIAESNGEPLQITGPEAREKTHQERLCADALLTTAKTILADDPKFNVRLENKVIAKPLYVLDRRLTLTGNEQVFKTTESITLFHSSEDYTAIKALENKGAKLSKVNEKDKKLNLQSVLDKIGEAGVQTLWVEVGGACFESFIKGKLTQEIWIYIAPGKKRFGLKAPAIIESLLKSKSRVKEGVLGEDQIVVIRKQ